MSIFGDSRHKVSTIELENKIGKDAVRTICNTDNILAFSVVKGGKSSGIRAEATVELPTNQAQELKKFLLNDEGYIFSRTKKCVFVPKITFRFKTTPKIVVMVDMLCNQMKFICADQAIIVDYDPMAESVNPMFREILAKINNRSTSGEIDE